MIRIDGANFKDDAGRTLLLRGVNLGGSSKLPTHPNGATHRPDALHDHRSVSFVGRPFPLEEADEHYGRLRSWGLTFLRFLVTWEAVEHAGPGRYDQAYLDYLEAVVARAGEHGLQLFIDPHQDVWSRFSGGDGAPGWTLEAAGFDLAQLTATGAAAVHGQAAGDYRQMSWPTNGSKLAAATMFTLFFGGRDFAPQLRIDGESIQESLQRHYIGAVEAVARRLARFDHVVGYDTLNEPQPGYIGHADLAQPIGALRIGPSPTPLQSWALGDGSPQLIPVLERTLTGTHQVGEQLLNPDGRRAWKADRACPWRENGVWDFDAAGEPRLLRPEYFARVGNRPVHFGRDYLKPFILRFAQRLRRVQPRTIFFVEGPYGDPLPPFTPSEAVGLVNAAHWYDGLTLFTKRFNAHLGASTRGESLAVGAPLVRRLFTRSLNNLRTEAQRQLDGAPTLVGEFGIPFDMHEKAAYHTGDFSRQVQALDRTLRALEDTLLHGTLWNYTADNSNQWGDQWNQEDLSIFSRDQQERPWDINSGGRALEAVVRPYPRKTAGEPLRLRFDSRKRTFDFAFRHDPAVSAPTEIFVPNFQYARGYVVTVSDGDYELDWATQTLTYRHTTHRDTHWIRIRPFCP